MILATKLILQYHPSCTWPGAGEVISHLKPERCWYYLITMNGRMLTYQVPSLTRRSAISPQVSVLWYLSCVLIHHLLVQLDEPAQEEVVVRDSSIGSQLYLPDRPWNCWYRFWQHRLWWGYCATIKIQNLIHFKYFLHYNLKNKLLA